MLAEHLGERQHQVGGGGAGGKRVVEAHPDNHRGEQEEGLTEQARLGLDTADAPAKNPDPVDHGGVRVRAHQGVGQRHSVAIDLRNLHNAGQVLEVDLMDDAHARGDDTESVEGLLRPAQQHVAFAVALVLPFDVA